MQYGFDYFLKRATLLTEMARPASLFNFVSPEFNQLYAKLLNDQLKQGITAPATRQIIIWRFIIDTINEFGEIYHNEDGELATSLEIAKQLTGATNHGALAKAVVQVLQDNINIAKSKQLFQFLSDPENIEKFKNYIGLGKDGASTSSRRMGKNNELQSITGQDISSMEQSTSNVRDLILTMNKVMGNRKKKKTDPNSPIIAEKQPSNYDPNVHFAEGIIDAIDSLIESKADYSQSLKSREMYMDELDRPAQALVNSKTADTDLKYLRDMYSKMIAEKSGTTEEEFSNFLNNLKHIKGMTPDRAYIFDLLAQEVQDLSSQDSLDDMFPNKMNGSESSYPGYDKDVVDKVLDSPEKKEAFDSWYRSHSAWRKAKNEKLEQLLTNKLIDIQMKLNPKLQGINNDELFINPAIQQYMSSIQGYEQMLARETNPYKEQAIQKKISDIQKKIAEIRQNKTPQPEEEEDIMDTFVESLDLVYQKTNGQFVDRGFKKPVNYAHWLMNQ